MIIYQFRIDEQLNKDFGLRENLTVKDFEENFLMEMQAKLPEVLLEFKKGNLPEDGLKSMTALAQDLMKQYK